MDTWLPCPYDNFKDRITNCKSYEEDIVSEEGADYVDTIDGCSAMS